MNAMKRHLKEFLFRANPRLATSYFSERARAHSHRIIKRWDVLMSMIYSSDGSAIGS
jgi:hypothetical protein